MYFVVPEPIDFGMEAGMDPTVLQRHHKSADDDVAKGLAGTVGYWQSYCGW